MDLEIYGTLGPSCCEEETIVQLFKKGMTGMRINLSHVNLQQAANWIEAFHKAAKRCSIKPDLLIDMQGPELRIGKVEKECRLNEIIDMNELDIPEVVLKELKKDQMVLIDDGKIHIQMIDSIKGKVVQEGKITSRKSIALPGVSIQLPSLTDTDIKNISMAKNFGVTGLMQPFVRNEHDLIYVKNKLKEYHTDIKIYAKIENEQGVGQIESLIKHCDQIIIARGDLANSVGLIQLPSVQRKIEEICKKNNMPYMIVTEMLYSMIKNASPTRAEVNDIYYAVYNGAKSIMLTAETAMGQYPVQAMEYFVEVAKIAWNDKKRKTL